MDCSGVEQVKRRALNRRGQKPQCVGVVTMTLVFLGAFALWQQQPRLSLGYVGTGILVTCSFIGLLWGVFASWDSLYSYLYSYLSSNSYAGGVSSLLSNSDGGTVLCYVYYCPIKYRGSISAKIWLIYHIRILYSSILTL